MRLEQVSTNDLTAVLRIQMVSRTVYLKTAETALEATVSDELAKNHPDLSPEVLAWDAARNLLLTKDCGARLSETADLGLWRRAVRKLAHFQRTADAASWQALGCPTRPFDTLAEQAAVFIQGDETLENWGLNAGRSSALKERLPHIVRAHTRIKRLGLPPLPSHGDAHPMNFLTGCGAVWFDWSEACIAHPMLDIGWFLAWLSHPGRVNLPLHQRHPSAATRLWQTYLESVELDALDLLPDVMLLALVHRILVYHERYFDWQGTVPDWRPQHVPFLLRSLLKLPL